MTRLKICMVVSEARRGWNIVPGMLISPYPDLLPNVFCLLVRMFRLMLALLYVV